MAESTGELELAGTGQPVVSLPPTRSEPGGAGEGQRQGQADDDGTCARVMSASRVLELPPFELLLFLALLLTLHNFTSHTLFSSHECSVFSKTPATTNTTFCGFESSVALFTHTDTPVTLTAALSARPQTPHISLLREDHSAAFERSVFHSTTTLLRQLGALSAAASSTAHTLIHPRAPQF